MIPGRAANALSANLPNNCHNKDSIKTPIAIPTAVNIDTIIIPFSLKSVLILLPSIPVSLFKNFVIGPLI